MSTPKDAHAYELTMQQKDLIEKSHAFVKLMSYYRCAMMEVETKFNVLNEEFSMSFERQPINSIKSRLKKPVSIREKLIAKGLPLTTDSIQDNLNDIAGIRVTCSFVDDVYMLADAFLNQDDIELVAKKDYIVQPKENGYRSLHLIVRIPIFLQQEKRMMNAEVQLRTIAMDTWASLEHQLRYKKEGDFDTQMAKELKDCAALCADLDSRMDGLYSKIYNTYGKQTIRGNSVNKS